MRAKSLTAETIGAVRHAGRLISALLLGVCALPPAFANLASPAWYDQNAVNTAPDWHYRVPISVPAGATVNSTIKLDVDFAALLSALGVSGTLDVNSPRVVRPTGALSANQEFTDTVYAGATDAAGNGRGEIRFILQDAGPATYYLYFDITANGAKPANPQTPINGNFEVGGAGTQNPVNWTATKANANFDAQVRPSETVSVTTNGGGVSGANPRNTDGTPYTGANAYMLGARTNNEPANANPAVTLTRSITVPAAAPGNLTVRYRPEGWDSSANGSTQYDFITIQVVGATTLNLVAPALNNYTTQPFSPNLRTGAASTTQSGYGQYNGFDCTTTGTHNNGMTVACNSEPWFTASASLAAFAGQTVTLRITSSNTTSYKTWFHIDDVEWSVVAATLGTPQAYGVNITAPTGASAFTGGQTMGITAVVDAQPTASGSPVTADIYDNVGNPAATGIVLYNDGTHGDAAANDNIWTNSSAYQIPAGLPSGSNWLARVYARDASASTLGATSGLIHIPGQPSSPSSQANFYNIDDQLFTVNVPLLINLKTVAILSDPVNGGTNPKYIPGAVAQYTLRITNSGAGTVDNNALTIIDPVPANTRLFTGNLGGGAPYLFTNGSPGSALTCPFVALNNTTDCVDFSSDNGLTWTYTPNGGYDPAVTHVRFRPSGAMAANTGSGNPYFEIRFNVDVK